MKRPTTALAEKQASFIKGRFNFLKGNMMDTRLLEQRNGIAFLDCLQSSLKSPLLAEWERLSGKRLVAKGVIDRMIDEATGYDMEVMREFADFVYTFVFSTMEDNTHG